MPIFTYKARDRQNRRVTNGTIEAKDKAEAIRKLRTKGLLILDIGQDHSINIALPMLNRVSNKDRILFAREFSVMMRAGLPILDALHALQDQTTSKTLKATLGGIAKEIEGGASLSDSFSHYPKIFPPIFASVSRIGERSGKLEEVLERLATQLEKDDDLTGKIKGAMIYPIFVLFSMVVVLIVIMLYIIPQLQGMFADAGVELPLLTRILLGTSALMQQYLGVVAIVLAVVYIAARIIIARSANVRIKLEALRLKVPIFGQLYRQMLMARMSHTLSTLLSAGLPMLEALKTTADVLRSPIYSGSLLAISKKIESGQTLSAGLLADKHFPVMLSHMIAIGEKSGQIDSVLETVAGFFDKEVDGLTRNLSALLEPILMLVMGLGVGVIVASVIVPIYGLVNAV